MIIYTEADHDESKIYHKDLQSLASSIDKFVDVYFANVYIEDKKNIEVLNKLKLISSMLKQCRYDELINDTSIISYEEPNDDYPF